MMPTVVSIICNHGDGNGGWDDGDCDGDGDGDGDGGCDDDDDGDDGDDSMVMIQWWLNGRDSMVVTQLSWFNGGAIVAQWWFNADSMLMQWWFNGDDGEEDNTATTVRQRHSMI